jgi:hypothetical protein
MMSKAFCSSQPKTVPGLTTLGVVVFVMFGSTLALGARAEAACAQIVLVPNKGTNTFPGDVLTDGPPNDFVSISVSFLQTCVSTAILTGETLVDLACASANDLTDPSGTGCNMPAHQLDALNFTGCVPATADVVCTFENDSSGNPTIVMITPINPLTLPFNTTVQAATITARTVPGANVVVPASGQFFITSSTGAGGIFFPLAPQGQALDDPDDAGSAQGSVEVFYPVPEQACPTADATVATKGKDVKWKMTAPAGHAFEISAIEIAFPTANGPLQEVRLGGPRIFHGSLTSPATITSFSGTTKDRTLGKDKTGKTSGKGKTETLKFTFKNKPVGAAGYDIVVAFTDGCVLHVTD